MPSDNETSKCGDKETHSKDDGRAHPPKRRHDDDDDRSVSSSSHERKRRKKHQKKKKSRDKKKRRHEESDDSASSVSSDDSSYYRERKRRKKEKKKRKKKHHKDRKKKKSRRDRDEHSDVQDDDKPSFGKYGILKASDYSRMQRTFQVWMAEVKGIPSFTGSKYELQQYFDEFREDFNTATMPHEKYYDYDKWEMQEYQKNKSQEQERSTKSSLLADEARHRQEVQERAREQERAALELTKSTMSREKVQAMKRQADLRSEMQIAFKTGDKKKYERLKERLAADEM